MSTDPHHHRRLRRRDPDSPLGVRATEAIFVRANPFLDAVWKADELGLCISVGCPDCGTLEFRRMLASLDGIPADAPLNAPRRLPPDAPGTLAAAVAGIDFDLLRIAPRWYDALDVALFHLRDRGELRFVLEDWVRRPAVPTRILDLVLFRHARYAFPDHRLEIGRAHV